MKIELTQLNSSASPLYEVRAGDNGEDVFLLAVPEGSDAHALALDSALSRQIPFVYPAPTLDQIKKRALARIDSEAEVSRQRYITPGSGQALEYNEAAEEAARYVATNGAGAYPMLQASVDAGEAADLASAAALISTRENAWATVGANIRRLRLTAKRAVDAAASVDEVAAAASVAWP